jgi:pimeloyl-ACP methyl ester carboxylesterase
VSWANKRRIDLSGGRMAVVDAGDPEAPAVVLVAGGFTSSFLWRSLIPLLSPWMRVLAPDLLGSGDSGVAADRSLRAHAASVRELLERLGVERFAVAGHGHGGGVAQLLALERGAEALVLVDSLAFDAWPAPAVRELRAGLDAVDAAFVESWLRSMVDRGMSRRERLGDGELAEYLRPFAGPGGVERFIAVASSFDGLGLEGLEPTLAELRIPALVLWGEDDAFVEAGVAERLGDALPMSTVALLPGCGHLVLEDASETAAPLVFRWLQSRYLKVEHRHEDGPVAVYLGRRPPGEEG